MDAKSELFLQFFMKDLRGWKGYVMARDFKLDYYAEMFYQCGEICEKYDEKIIIVF